MKVRRNLSSGFTDLLVPVKQRSFRQLQSFYALLAVSAVHLNPVGILGEVFSSLEEGKGAMKAIFYSQQSHINSL